MSLSLCLVPARSISLAPLPLPADHWIPERGDDGAVAAPTGIQQVLRGPAPLEDLPVGHGALQAQAGPGRQAYNDFDIVLDEFGTISPAFLSSIPPHTRHTTCPTVCTFSSDAEWCLQSDFMSHSRPLDLGFNHASGKYKRREAERIAKGTLPPATAADAAAAAAAAVDTAAAASTAHPTCPDCALCAMRCDVCVCVCVCVK